MLDLIEDKLAALVGASLEKAIKGGKLEIDRVPPITIERPREESHGDWACNISMVIAKQAGRAPRDIAAIIIEGLGDSPLLEGVDIAGPGFINFKLSSGLLRETLATILEAGDKFGIESDSLDQKIQIEFVSANPVGPMHVGHGRWAALGDSLARLLEAAGYQVEREFYINDYGNQMKIFGASVAARYREILGRPADLPEDGYQGHYIIDIAQEIVDSDGEAHLELDYDAQADLFTDRSYRAVLDHIKGTLEEMDVKFDTWFSERSLHESGAVAATLRAVKKRGLTKEEGGALWLKTSDFGDDKDRVLVRENGQPTYFAADVAYHRDKFARGFDRLINIWGADHHGHVKRVKAAMSGFDVDPDRLEIIIGQLVNLFSGDRPIRMSKRTGEMVTLEELLSEVGRDAARYFFLMRGTDTALDFDIELAKSHTSDNPVYYVQYAHARICSLLRHAGEEGLGFEGNEELDLSLLVEEAELRLMRKLADAPSVVRRAAEVRAPHRLTTYLESVAAAFHQFYHQCRVVSDDRQLSLARLALVGATRQVLKNVLGLLGVSAPQEM